MSSKKRRREQTAVDTQLVEIFEDLANIDEKIRLRACHNLLVNFVSEGAANGDQLNEILRRLFRGLCSGRKAARLGFSIALTEFLTELLGPKGTQVPGFHNISDLIQTLQKQTHVSGNVSGQEERDHQFGRLFGAESIIKSGILFQSTVHEDLWAQVLGMICELASKRPWLREECGFVLFNALKTVRNQDLKYAQMIIEKLHSKSLAKTAEGLAVWIVAQDECPNLRFPRHVWKNDDPLDRREGSALAKILSEGFVTETVQDGGEIKATQKGAWSTKVHFAWDVVLAKFLHKGLQHETRGAESIHFADFWENCVDNILFATASSEERKFWGFLLFQHVIRDAPVDFIAHLFMKNFVRCLMNQLSSSERFLHLAAEKTTKIMIARARSESDSRLPILKALLTPPYGAINFDKITKTKTVQSLLSQSNTSDSKELVALYEELLLRPGVLDEKDAVGRRLAAADQLVFAVQTMQIELTDSGQSRLKDTGFIGSVLRLLSKCAYFDLEPPTVAHASKPSPPLTQLTRKVLRTRISSCLAHIIAKHVDPAKVSYDLIGTLYDRHHKSNPGNSLLEADETVSQIMRQAWKYIKKANSKSEANHLDLIEWRYYRSIMLLYSLTMLQVYNEDADAVSVLQELNSCSGWLLDKRRVEHGSATLVEILLSFASKPSQLFRRLTQEVFTVYAPYVDEFGLQPMLKILGTKESLSGQAEAFDLDRDESDDADEGNDPAGASDVEDIDTADTNSTVLKSRSAIPSGTNDSSDSNYDSGSPDNELAAFNAKLEKAVGIRSANQDMSAKDSSSSGEDMDDEQMEALDQHLEKVFRERQKLTSKKTEKKEAKENIIHFKCRVLELLEINVKQQHDKTLALSLLLPLLKAIRLTSSPLVSSKACNLIRVYSQSCKGDGLPRVEDIEALFEQLQNVHVEAGKEASNSHGSACSQASLLLVRVLVARDRELLKRVIKIYANTQEATLFDPSCKVKTSLFTDWLNWCTSARK